MAKLDFKSAAKRNKNLKYGGYAAVVTVICVVILVVVNLLFQKLNLTIDLTKEELYTVSEETMEILDELDSEVDIYLPRGVRHQDVAVLHSETPVVRLPKEEIDHSEDGQPVGHKPGLGALLSRHGNYV